jgi:hypothetical protein
MTAEPPDQYFSLKSGFNVITIIKTVLLKVICLAFWAKL